MQQKAIAALNFKVPTPIQSLTVPQALAGESFTALAPTGTGKTLVYALALWKMSASPLKSSKALVLLPTRELAYQVSQMLQALHQPLRDEIILVLGGHDKRQQTRELGHHEWRIMLATPGRLIDLLKDQPKLLRDIKILVIDEFDKLIGMGFEEQIAEILKQLPATPQKLLFSATDAELGKAEAMGFALPRFEATVGPKALEELFYFLKSDKKKGPLLLQAFAENIGQTLVFVRNREKANHLHGLLLLKGVTAMLLHGHLDQSQRARVFQEFKAGKCKILIATDLAARGLDMSQVTLIVNHDLPQNYKDYVHRIGRTARAGRSGRCISFAGPREYIQMRNIQEEYPPPLPCHPDYAQIEPWTIQAKRFHAQETKRDKKKDSIRKAQGIGEDSESE